MVAPSHRCASSLLASRSVHIFAQFAKELRPSGMYCSAFKWECLVLDLSGPSTVFFCHFQSRQNASSKPMSCTLRSLHPFPFSVLFRRAILLELCLDQLRRLIPWRSLSASHHDLFSFAVLKHPLFALKMVHWPGKLAPRPRAVCLSRVFCLLYVFIFLACSSAIRSFFFRVMLQLFFCCSCFLFLISTAPRSFTFVNLPLGVLCARLHCSSYFLRDFLLEESALLDRFFSHQRMSDTTTVLSEYCRCNT